MEGTSSKYIFKAYFGKYIYIYTQTLNSSFHPTLDRYDTFYGFGGGGGGSGDVNQTMANYVHHPPTNCVSPLYRFLFYLFSL
jgi:hypothetical protein